MVRVTATAGEGTTPTAIVVDAVKRGSSKVVASCTIGKRINGTTIGTRCSVKGLKKGMSYQFVAHALTYGIGSSERSARTAAVRVK